MEEEDEVDIVVEVLLDLEEGDLVVVMAEVEEAVVL